MLGGQRGQGINIDFSDFWAKRRADREFDTVSSHTALLEEKVDKLTIICLGLWSLLKEKAHFTEQELLDHMARVDMLDGKADGKVQMQAGTCPQCGRALSAKFHQCMYCGCHPTDELGLIAAPPVPKSEG